MSNIKQLTGVRGVYLVAAELSKRGFIAVPTSRSARGADILVTNQNCTIAFSVQVKTNTRTFNLWLLNKDYGKMVSDTHIYVLVNIRTSKDRENIDYFVVPSEYVANHAETSKAKTTSSVWHQIYLKDVEEFRDKWDMFSLVESQKALPS